MALFDTQEPQQEVLYTKNYMTSLYPQESLEKKLGIELRQDIFEMLSSRR